MNHLEGNKTIPKNYDNFDLYGKKMFCKDKEKVIDAIKKIHQSVGWDESDNTMSILRYTEDSSRSVFAVSKEDMIVGYATAKEQADKKYYLSFIAVNNEKQTHGIGRALLLRVIEKVQKKGGTSITIDYEDSDELKTFYKSDKIPYKKQSQDHHHKFRKTGYWVNKIKYSL